MHILFATYPWAFDCPGGGERQLLAYQNHLKALGFTADLFNQWQPQFENADIFHFFSVMPGSLQICSYAKEKGLALVVSPNLYVTNDTKHLYPHEDIRSMLQLADCILVNSNAESKMLSEVYEVDVSKFHVAYNGVERQFDGSADPALFSKSNDIRAPYVLNVANVEPRKNQLSFLHALKSRPELTLVTIGTIRDEAYAAKCKEASPGKFIVLDALPYNSEELRSAIAGCEFFAMPSLVETPSIAALEAYACGAPLLVTREGSTTEYFGEDVVFVDPHSHVSLEKALGDSRLKKRNGPPKDFQFHWNVVIKDVVKAYAATLDEAKRN